MTTPLTAEHLLERLTRGQGFDVRGDRPGSLRVIPHDTGAPMIIAADEYARLDVLIAAHKEKGRK